MTAPTPISDSSLSLYHLLTPEVLADPYPLYRRLREQDPVHWDSFLYAWVVTRYADVVHVLTEFSADRTPTPEHLALMGMEELDPIAKVMVRQMLFLDAPAHTRIRSLCASAFTVAKVAQLEHHIGEIAGRLIAQVVERGEMDMIADFAAPLPAIVTAEMLGVPASDHSQLKDWSTDFAEILGNFQHNPGRTPKVLAALQGMLDYFRAAIRELERRPRPGMIHSLMTAEVDGARLTEEEIIANTILTMVGGQETTTNLIGNGIISLLNNPDQMELLKRQPEVLPSAVEELLRYASPTQHTARLAPEDVVLGGKTIRRRQAVIAVLGAANRDPERFPDPDRLDLRRPDNRHVAFGWAAHYCFGAALARLEGRISFALLLRALPELELAQGATLTWRQNLALRGLEALPVRFATGGHRD